jgi:dihydrofolate reductase
MKVTLIAALTTDGFIGRDKDHTSTQWTSKEDAAHFRATTKELGVMVMGRTTYETIGRPLPGRTTIVYSRSAPQKLEQDTTHENLFHTSLTPQELVEALATRGHSQLAVCGGSSIYRLFMEAGVVDELQLTIEPILFGGGIKLFDTAFSENMQLHLDTVTKLSEQTLLLTYQTKKNG